MVTVTLEIDQLELLHTAHLEKDQSGTGPHHDLLQEHCNEFCEIFGLLIDKGVKKAKVRFSRLQALAFMQLWIGQELPRTPALITIQSIIEDIDQKSKQLQLV